MNSYDFNHVLAVQIERMSSVLVQKADEYATDDRLHNFKVAANLQGVTQKQALAGMMAKHTVSIYDMLDNEKDFPIHLWYEKITDHMNYLVLLLAIVEEERNETSGD